MDKITESLLKEFTSEHDLAAIPDEKRFEQFASYITVRRQHGETFDTADIVTTPRPTSISKVRESNTPFGPQPTASCKSGSPICSSALLAVHQMKCGVSMRTSRIRPEAGRSRVGFTLSLRDVEDLLA